jgi:hypothetical protein
MKALEKCTKNPKLLGEVVNKSKTKLRMYINYCQNKPYSEHIVNTNSEFFEKIRIKLKQNLGVSLVIIYNKISKNTIFSDYSTARRHVDQTSPENDEV